jgi:hypothetical protein
VPAHFFKNLEANLLGNSQSWMKEREVLAATRRRPKPDPAREGHECPEGE